MYIQSIDSSSFGKNTYLSQAKSAVNKGDKARFKELYCTAKSRAYDIKSYRTLSEGLTNLKVAHEFGFYDFCSMIKTITKSLYEQTASLYYENKAASLCRKIK